MNAHKQRPKIKSITVLLEDGRSRVFEGEFLDDAKGGVLVWNEFGARKMMKSAYRHNGENQKAEKVDEIWDGSTTAASDELPAIMIKPFCEPSGWP